VDRRRLSAIAHTHHPIAAPVSPDRVRLLLDRALPPVGGRVLDLGCGGGAWVAAGLALRPALLAVGVDDDPLALGRAASAVGDHSARVELVAIDAATFEDPRPFDVVLCVGASHAFGGLDGTLAGAGRHVATGGRLVVGEGFWERPPHEGTLAAGFVADDHRALPDLVDAVAATGWEVELGHVSTADEWDDYEWSWTGSAVAWALDHPDDPGAADALAGAREHRHHWLRGWRNTLGFVTLVLRRAPSA
jgi:SAM-dependent methyltransferase